MPTTPNITLTAMLDDLTGAAAGSTANPAKLRIALCGYGPALPVIAGTAMLAKTGPFGVYSTGGGISTPLWGNDQILPANTYYSIEILDGEDNVVQCGAYQFTGPPATIDLSNAVQILPPFNLGFFINTLNYMKCTMVGGSGGSVFTSPGQPVIAVAYNGILLGSDSYTVSGTQITLTGWSIELGDRIDAFCIFH